MKTTKPASLFKCIFLLFILSSFTVLSSVASAGGNNGEHIKSWDRVIKQANSRFKNKGLFKSEAVIDRETQLVWEKEGSLTPLPYGAAANRCLNLEKGNRMGWRTPSANELASLIVPNSPDFPKLTKGHPFKNMMDVYWSSTGVITPTSASITINVYAVSLDNGTVFPQSIIGDGPYYSLCVRGGSFGTTAQ